MPCVSMSKVASVYMQYKKKQKEVRSKAWKKIRIHKYFNAEMIILSGLAFISFYSKALLNIFYRLHQIVPVQVSLPVF